MPCFKTFREIHPDPPDLRHSRHFSLYQVGSRYPNKKEMLDFRRNQDKKRENGRMSTRRLDVIKLSNSYSVSYHHIYFNT